MLKAREGARDDLAHGAYACGYLLVGVCEVDAGALLCGLAAQTRFRQ